MADSAAIKNCIFDLGFALETTVVVSSFQNEIVEHLHYNISDMTHIMLSGAIIGSSY